MDLNFPVTVKIQRPLDEVFDAIYNPDKLSRYFTTNGASDFMDTGKTITWDFADFPGAFPVTVLESIKNEKLVFEWQANDPQEQDKENPYNNKVTMNFKVLSPENTEVTILETGWKENAYRAAAGNAQGWMHMACCLKAFVEYGINLRQGFFKD